MIFIIDYKTGNLGSIKNMIKKAGYQATITDNPKDLENASKIILPGVGKFDFGVENLKKYGFWEQLNNIVLNKQIPILGICLGFQLMTQTSEEGKHSGLGWFDAKTVLFDKNKLKGLKIPNMGWHNIELKKQTPLFDGIQKNYRFYFVHSYHVEASDKDQVIAFANYGYPFVAAMQKNNIFGVQFHPEKSLRYGMQILKNFIEKI